MTPSAFCLGRSETNRLFTMDALEPLSTSIFTFSTQDWLGRLSALQLKWVVNLHSIKIGSKSTLESVLSLLLLIFRRPVSFACWLA